MTQDSTVFFYDHPSAPTVIPLDDGYSMTLQAIPNKIAHLTISHETDGANIVGDLFLLKCLADGETTPIYRQEGTWMIVYHQDYELYYKNTMCIRLVHPLCHEIIRI